MHHELSRRILRFIVGASLLSTPAFAQQTQPQPTTKPTTTLATKAEDVSKWTRKQWEAAKAKWSKDKAKWNACNKQATDQKLLGRKSWSYLNDCMNKA